MNSLWQIPAVVVAVLSWLNAPSAGLADIAQREAFRREATQKSKASLTNLGVPPEAVPGSAVWMPPPDAPPTDPNAATAASATAKPGEAAKQAKDESKQPKEESKPKDEAWWRTRMTEVRTVVERGQMTADALQSRINALKADAVNIDDPFKQTRVRLDLVKGIEELERVNKQLETDRKAMAALQDEARRQNVPPGWIR